STSAISVAAVAIPHGPRTSRDRGAVGVWLRAFVTWRSRALEAGVNGRMVASTGTAEARDRPDLRRGSKRARQAAPRCGLEAATPVAAAPVALAALVTRLELVDREDVVAVGVERLEALGLALGAGGGALGIVDLSVLVGVELGHPLRTHLLALG